MPVRLTFNKSEEKGIAFAPFLVGLGGTFLPGTGAYRFQVLVGGEVAGEVPLYVTVNGVPEETATFTLRSSPNDPGIGTAAGLSLSLFAPHSDRSASLIINAAVLDFQQEITSSDGVQVRNAMVMSSTDETQTVTLSLDEPEQAIVHSGSLYVIRLLKVSSVDFDGQRFPSYDFLVTRN